MAVPKSKISKSKRNMRRSHSAINLLNIIEDKNSGEPRLSHKLDMSTGIYNGKQIIIKKDSKVSTND
jgi:large subunit ribosomal protein L32